MIEKKLKTEKIGFFGMTKDLFGKTSEKKVLRTSSCARVQSFSPILRTVFEIYSKVYILDMVVISLRPRSRDRGPTHPSEQFLGIPPLTQSYDFDAIAPRP